MPDKYINRQGKLMKIIILVTLVTLTLALPACAEHEDLFIKMKQLAENGDPEAQYHLGMFYNNGIGTTKNAPLAFEWFQKSAEGGDPLGNYKLGCYYGGQGQFIITLDQEKALQYKLVAAQAGYSLAQYDVANILLEKGDYLAAIHWLKSAGEQGSFAALNALFNEYYRGGNVKKDIYSAYLYLNLASKTANAAMPPHIKSIRDELSTKISANEKSKADKIIVSWKPKPSQLTIKALNGLQEAEGYVNKK
jgi:hypothetical protein